MDETLELRREHQVDEHDGQEEEEVEAAARLAEFLRLSAQLPLHPGRELRAHDQVEIVERFPEADPWDEIRRDRRRPLPVVVIELLRRHRLLDLDHVGQLHQPAVPA